MQKALSLSDYIKRRNGRPLGATGSMSNMLKRSLGANSFQRFWHYWNPIWGFYLSRNVMRPLSRFLPVGLAVILTFAVSGALHDLAVALVKWRLSSFFTLWFTLMGTMVVISNRLGISYGQYPWPVRALLNLSFIGFCLTLAVLLI